MFRDNRMKPHIAEVEVVHAVIYMCILQYILRVEECECLYMERVRRGLRVYVNNQAARVPLSARRSVDIVPRGETKGVRKWGRLMGATRVRRCTEGCSTRVVFIAVASVLLSGHH
ncbi:hypothetical protein KQX54_007504 [Cotesia glomerata]|uniref:Uncharacterized protein n=1 Tax=Cotesia glomerata TaxID=32391 RepID=A0AAV7IPB0_COTGL|nr:hypothetical protein KQX54_007504 [Cotesia glomerata]